MYALVCEKESSHLGENNGNSDLVCEKSISILALVAIFSAEC